MLTRDGPSRALGFYTRNPLPACRRRPPASAAILPALLDAILAAHGEFPADQRPGWVDAAQQGVAVQRRAPAVRQPRHGLSAPGVGGAEALGPAGVGDQHHLQAAAAGGAGGAG